MLLHSLVGNIYTHNYDLIQNVSSETHNFLEYTFCNFPSRNNVALG